MAGDIRRTREHHHTCDLPLISTATGDIPGSNQETKAVYKWEKTPTNVTKILRNAVHRSQTTFLVSAYAVVVRRRVCGVRMPYYGNIEYLPIQSKSEGQDGCLKCLLDLLQRTTSGPSTHRSPRAARRQP